MVMPVGMTNCRRCGRTIYRTISACPTCGSWIPGAHVRTIVLFLAGIGILGLVAWLLIGS